MRTLRHLFDVLPDRQERYKVQVSCLYEPVQDFFLKVFSSFAIMVTVDDGAELPSDPSTQTMHCRRAQTPLQDSEQLTTPSVARYSSVLPWPAIALVSRCHLQHVRRDVSVNRRDWCPHSERPDPVREAAREFRSHTQLRPGD